MSELEIFWKSKAGINFYQNLTVIGFWISTPIFLFLTFLLFRINKKYEARKNEIRKLLDSPHRSDAKWFFKHVISEHGIGAANSAPKKVEEENGD